MGGMVNLLVGLAVIASPYLLGFTQVLAAMAADYVLGALVVLAAGNCGQSITPCHEVRCTSNFAQLAARAFPGAG